MAPTTEFDIDIPEIESGQTLLVGLASPGMAGLTAVNQVVKSVESREIGYISPTDLPGITPFEDGTPRHHTRLYDLVGTDVIVLVGELFVPAWAARSFADSLLQWSREGEVSEIAFLHTVAYPHGPDDHRVFHVATDAYRDRRLTGQSTPMKGGVLDGVAGEVVNASLGADGPPVGVFITPAHPPGPDVDGALLFLDAVENIYDISVDRTELEELSREIKQYYETLDERLATINEADEGRDERDFYADRMYM